jgi:hypothetical protein
VAGDGEAKPIAFPYREQRATAEELRDDSIIASLELQLGSPINRRDASPHGLKAYAAVVITSQMFY